MACGRCAGQGVGSTSQQNIIFEIGLTNSSPLFSEKQKLRIAAHRTRVVSRNSDFKAQRSCARHSSKSSSKNVNDLT